MNLDKLVALKREAHPNSQRAWAWRVAVGVFIFIGLVAIRLVLLQKEKRIAELEADRAIADLAARNAKERAEQAEQLAYADRLKREADDLAHDAFVKKEYLDSQVRVLASENAKVEAIRSNDWEALNRAAGVIP